MRRAAFALAIFLVAARPVEGQQGIAISVLGGVTPYDLNGAGTTWFSALRFEVLLGRFVIVEPGLGYMPYTTQSEERVHHFFPEAQIQGQYTMGSFRPYLGLGAGRSLAFRSGPDVIDLTLSAAGGVRVDLHPDWAARAELRIRSIDPFAGVAFDFGIGLVRRLQ